MRDFTAALVQMRALPDTQGSVGVAERWIRDALQRECDLVVLPENCCGFAPAVEKRAAAFRSDAPERSPMLQPFFALSHGFDGLLVLGGVPERCDDTRIYNTLLVLQRGCIVASYRKIHRFDATLSDGSVYRESEVTAAGHDPIVLETPFARLGLSICYDLRFPEHFRALASAGAEVMLVPSAFTVPTGRAHWEVLLRARAIEAQAFVLAPAQYGDHGHGRTSFGHTMAIDPWGRVLACQPAGEAVLHVDLQARVLDETRAALPTHAHHVLSPETSARVVTLPADAFPRRTPP